MSQLSEIAYAHQNTRIQLSHSVAASVLKQWRRIDVNNLDRDWPYVAPTMAQQVIAGQLAAAHQTTGYINAVNDIDDHTPTPTAIVPQAFTNVMGDGREIGPALYGAITKTKSFIGGGMAPSRAFEVGANFLALIAQAAVTDLGRSADMALSTGYSYTYYVRVVGGAACSRCAILAGISSGSEAFERHVHCQCTAAPVTETRKSGDRYPTYDKSGVPSGLFDGPQEYFDSLSAAEQDRVFTKDGAEAIRQGADIFKVVNSRRGAYGIGYGSHGATRVPVPTRNSLTPVKIGIKADGSPLLVYATREGTTYRGEFARGERARGAAAIKNGRYTRTTSIRLMPEQIRVMAGGNTERYRELLIRYGYLTPGFKRPL